MRCKKHTIFCLILILVGVLLPCVQTMAESTGETHSRIRSKILEDSLIQTPGIESFQTFYFQENLGQVPLEGVNYYGHSTDGLIGFTNSKVILWMDGSEDILEMTFEGGNDVAPVASDYVNFYSNYFLGDRGTYTNVRTFSSVQFTNIWEGINLVYRATSNGAEYEFVVNPGVNPDIIRMRYESKTNLPDVSDSINFYHVSSSVIQPLMYGTYLGGSGTDSAKSIAVDSDGCAYVAGETNSLNLPVMNAVNDTALGGIDCFVFKLNATGNGLEYATYIGGSSDDLAASIDVDDEGNAVVVGTTISNDFPTANAYDDAYHNADDAFAFKLNPEGDELLYSTYLNGWSDDQANSVELDSQGNAVIVGTTGSEEFPIVNAYDPTIGWGWDCFVLKLNSTGNGIIYSTYVERSMFDKAFDVALDDIGNAYVIGRTGGEDSDVYAFKLNSTGNGLEYSRVMSSYHFDWGYSIAVDSQGCAYLTGYSLSSEFPTDNNWTIGNGNTFLVKLDIDGNIEYSRFVGVGHAGKEGSIALDAKGNILITGIADDDCFVWQISPNGEEVLYETSLGGSDIDSGEALAIGPQGALFLTGTTTSSDFEHLNGYNVTHGGAADFFVVRLDFEGPLIDIDFTPRTPTDVQEVTVTASVTDISGVGEVSLSYSTDGGAYWLSSLMSEKDGSWTGTLSTQDAGVTVEFKVIAYDVVRNWAESVVESYIVIGIPSTTTSTTTTSGSTEPSMDSTNLIVFLGIGMASVLVIFAILKRKITKSGNS